MGKVFPKFFKLIIIGFVIFVFPVNRKTPHAGYQDNRLRVVSFQEALGLNPKKSYLFFMASGCQYCRQIEEEIVSWALKRTKQVYFVVLDKKTRFCEGYQDILIHEINQNFCIWGTPSLYFVDGKKIIRTFIGISQISAFLKENF